MHGTSCSASPGSSPSPGRRRPTAIPPSRSRSILDSYSVDPVATVDTLFNSFAERGLDRSLDLLLAAEFQQFFSLTADTGSYTGNLLAAARAVAQNDIPISPSNPQQLTSQLTQVSPSPDYEYDTSDGNTGPNNTPPRPTHRRTNMTDADLADIIIERFNKLIENPDVRADVGRLLEQRVSCSPATKDHPTIQVVDGGVFGLLGLLNGAVGTISDGPRRGWGYISAEFSDEGKLVSFKRTFSS